MFFTEKTDPKFWTNLKRGTFVTLSDSQGIEDSIDKGGSVKGVDYKVKSKKTITEVDDMATWIFFKLKGDQELYLMAKIVDEDVDLAIYFEANNMESGSRDDVLCNDGHWVFQPPEDEDEFEVSELLFTKSVIQDVEHDDGTEETLIYEQKSQGELFGHVVDDPRPSGNSEMLATVVEYVCGTECENPLYLILEEGNEEDDENSFVQFFFGCNIGFSEIDVL